MTKRERMIDELKRAKAESQELYLLTAAVVDYEAETDRALARKASECIANIIGLLSVVIRDLERP